jgi:hypothetical protein
MLVDGFDSLAVTLFESSKTYSFVPTAATAVDSPASVGRSDPKEKCELLKTQGVFSSMAFFN